jgi:mono/diheme cytochrome c family protein
VPVILRIGLLFAAIGVGIPAQTKPDPAKGNEVFDEQCSGCHYADREDRKAGPGLKWLYVKGKLESNGKAVGDASVLEILDRGARGMPSFRKALSDQDRIDLLSYLRTL